MEIERVASAFSPYATCIAVVEGGQVFIALNAHCLSSLS